jgi:hypothetical protein
MTIEFLNLYQFPDGQDLGGTTIDRITSTCLGLIAEAEDSIWAHVRRDLLKHLGYVACTEHLVHHCKVCYTVLGVKERRKYTPIDALTP